MQLLEMEQNGGTMSDEAKKVFKEAQQIIDFTDRHDRAKQKIRNLNNAEKNQQDEDRRKGLIGEAEKMKSNLQAGMRQNFKDMILEEKLKIHMELVRRKLDFEVIKDNFENKYTE